MTDDAADLKLLGLANGKRKFAILVESQMPESLQNAFERGIDREWFTLVDVSADIAAVNGRLTRVFRLTDAGMSRLSELAQMEGVRSS
jgi:hypothetical protein